MTDNDFVKLVQSRLGVAADGYAGLATMAALDKALPPRVAAPVAALPWITEASAVLGLHEVRDKARLSAWLKSGGKYLGDPSQLPWCGDFVETALAKALPDETFPANPFFARNWGTWGVNVKTNIPYGAIGVFERGPNSGHVGFLVGISGSTYEVLGGNQGDTVSQKPILKTRLLAARWPINFPVGTKMLPHIGPSGAVSFNEH